MSSNYKPGLGNVGSYQVSGIPFVFNVSASTTKTATLNRVTSEVQITTSGTGCTVSFGDSLSTTYTLPAGLSTFRIKCKSIKIITPGGTTASCCASLTSIESSMMPVHAQTDYGSVA
jgi:hypothetical protein